MKRKREYPAQRAATVMKKPNIPGVQGFNLRNGMSELEQRSYGVFVEDESPSEPAHENESFLKLIESNDSAGFSQPHDLTDPPSWKCDTHTWHRDLLPKIEFITTILTSMQQLDCNFFSDFNPWSTLEGCLPSRNLEANATTCFGLLPFVPRLLCNELWLMVTSTATLELKSPEAFFNRLAQFRTLGNITKPLEWASHATSFEMLGHSSDGTPFSGVCKYLLDNSLWDTFTEMIKELYAHLMAYLTADSRTTLGTFVIVRDSAQTYVGAELILSREGEITKAHQNPLYTNLLTRRFGFAALCQSLLREAQLRYDQGDSSLLELLLKHKIHKRWWQIGWQTFLSYVYDHDRLEEMEIYIQQAYNEVTRLKYEVPALAVHWEDCLKGLDIYTRRLRYRKTALARTSDDENGIDWEGTLINLSKHWHRPVSTICSVVLHGWSILGSIVETVVYLLVGWVFCNIDRNGHDGEK